MIYTTVCYGGILVYKCYMVKYKYIEILIKVKRVGNL